MNKLKIVVAGVAGFLTAYFLDPDRGRARRSLLANQIAARGRKGVALLGSRARYQAGVARGIIHRIGKLASRGGEDVIDGDTLLQKVRSEAVGQWKRSAQDPNEIDVFVDQGNVAVVGSVANKKDHDKLIELVLKVDGVTTLEDRLSVG